MTLPEGPFTCVGCGVPMFRHANGDDTWGFVDAEGRRGTEHAPDGRSIYEILNEMGEAIMADCKQAKKKGNSLQLPEWYTGWYSLYSSNPALNPFRHVHRVVEDPWESCPWHCGEPMWLRPTGWHCRAGCQEEPFDPLTLDWVMNEAA